MEIPPLGVARGKTKVLREGRAAWLAGPIESLPLCEPSLAGRGGAVAFFGFGAEPAFERVKICCPGCPRAAPQVGTRGLARAGTELGSGPEEGEAGKSDRRRSVPYPAAASASPAPPAGLGALGAGPALEDVRLVLLSRAFRAQSLELAVLVEVVSTLRTRKSRPEGVWFLPSCFTLDFRREGRSGLLPVANALSLSSASPHPKLETWLLPTSLTFLCRSLLLALGSLQE